MDRSGGFSGDFWAHFLIFWRHFWFTFGRFGGPFGAGTRGGTEKYIVSAIRFTKVVFGFCECDEISDFRVPRGARGRKFENFEIFYFLLFRFC